MRLKSQGDELRRRQDRLLILYAQRPSVLLDSAIKKLLVIFAVLEQAELKLEEFALTDQEPENA